MSRLYEMTVTVRNFDPAKADRIQDAAADEWEWDNWNVHDARGLRVDCVGVDAGPPAELFGYGKDCLTGGESEEHFADRLAAAIMHANNAPCQVELAATCLEDLPFERHVRDVEDYDRLKPLFPVPEEFDDGQ